MTTTIYVISIADENGYYISVAAGDTPEAAQQVYELWKTEQDGNPHYQYELTMMSAVAFRNGGTY